MGRAGIVLSFEHTATGRRCAAFRRVHGYRAHGYRVLLPRAAPAAVLPCWDSVMTRLRPAPPASYVRQKIKNTNKMYFIEPCFGKQKQRRSDRPPAQMYRSCCGNDAPPPPPFPHEGVWSSVSTSITKAYETPSAPPGCVPLTTLYSYSRAVVDGDVARVCYVSNWALGHIWVHQASLGAVRRLRGPELEARLVGECSQTVAAERRSLPPVCLHGLRNLAPRYS